MTRRRRHRTPIPADARCVVCRSEALPDDVRCEPCLSRCIACGKPVDSSTKGQFSTRSLGSHPHFTAVNERLGIYEDKYGRYCTEHAEVNDQGMFRCWQVAFDQIVDDREREAFGRLWMRICQDVREF